MLGRIGIRMKAAGMGEDQMATVENERQEARDLTADTKERHIWRAKRRKRSKRTN